jgi:hypothetical protein
VEKRGETSASVPFLQSPFCAAIKRIQTREGPRRRRRYHAGATITKVLANAIAVFTELLKFPNIIKAEAPPNASSTPIIQATIHQDRMGGDVTDSRLSRLIESSGCALRMRLARHPTNTPRASAMPPAILTDTGTLKTNTIKNPAIQQT